MNYAKFYSLRWLRLAITGSFLLFFAGAIQAQTGYAYIHLKNLNEESSPVFNYTVRNSANNLVAFQSLSDLPNAYKRIFDMGADAGGGLFALAANELGATNSGYTYYKAPGVNKWVYMSAGAFRIDGANSGGYISTTRSSASLPVGVGDRIYYKPDVSTPEADITGNLAGKQFWEVSDNWFGMRYVLASDRIIYKRYTGHANWTTTSITNVRLMDAVPHTYYIVYVENGSNIVKRAHIDGTGAVDVLGDPPLSSGTVNNIAVGNDGTVWVTKFNRLYRHNGSTWVEEQSALNLTHLTAGPRNMLWGALAGGDEGIDERPARIFSRTHTGEFIDDQRIDNRIQFNTTTAHAYSSNTTLLYLDPGTYTIQQSAAAGWHTTDIRIHEITSPSTFNIAAGSATIVVSANEVVHVEFENQLTQSSVIANTCAGQAFKEDFGTYNPSTGNIWGNPLTGLTSYHKGNFNFGYGYYGLVNNASRVHYGLNINDKTSGDGTGRMLLVDAGYEKGTFYRRRFTGLVNGAKYNFSAWIANINNQNAIDKPNVSFELYRVSDGALISSVNTGNITQAGKWINQTMIFTATGEDIELVLRNNTTGTRGNDLAIDDISFSMSIPQAEAVVTPSCEANQSKITVTAPLSTNATGDNVFEYSIDGVNWQTDTVFSGLGNGNYTLGVRYKNPPPDGSCNAIAALEIIKPEDCELLPVSLAEFSATKINNNVLLHWATVTEQHNKGFEVEHSADGANWSLLSFIETKAENGNANAMLKYDYTDTAPIQGANYYRLKQIDIDGQYEYSKLLIVMFDDERKITVYPNPVSDKLTITGLKGDEVLIVYDGLGRKIMHNQSAGSRHTMNFNALAEGIYYVHILAKDGRVTLKKVVKVK